MADPAFAPFFAPGSQAEVSVAGLVQGRPVSGQIDRLAMDGDTILIADYKTNDPAPRSLDAVPEAYLGQMAVYAALVAAAHPSCTVTAHLVWTAEARLMTLPPESAGTGTEAGRWRRSDGITSRTCTRVCA